jgi:diadenosine tetraphosphate (Ap4A) HIT family hydrolase
MPDFQLHPQLQKDCFILGKFELCQVLLMNDCQFPWLILVPQRDGIHEIYELTNDEQILLIQESSYLAKKLAELFNADKLNIAAIGNVVPQLHIHHVVRYENDNAWSAPIWGKFPPIPYSEKERDFIVKKLKREFTL